MNRKSEKSAQTHYDILGVTSDASDQEIRTAFISLASKTHPDKGGDAEEFKIINNAYMILSNADERRAYDRDERRAYDRDERRAYDRVVIPSPVDTSETPENEALLKLILDNATTLPVDPKEIAKMKKLSKNTSLIKIHTQTHCKSQIMEFRRELLKSLEDLCIQSHIKWFIGTNKVKTYQKGFLTYSLSDLIDLNQRMLGDINEALDTLNYLYLERPGPITNLLKASEAYTAINSSFKKKLDIMLSSELYSSNSELKDDIDKIRKIETSKGQRLLLPFDKLSIAKIRLVEERLLTFEIQHIKILWSSLLDEDVNPIPTYPEKMVDLAPWIAAVQDALNEPLKKNLRDDSTLLPNVDVSTLDHLPFHTLVRLNKALDCNRILADIHTLCRTDADKQYIQGIQRNISQEQNITVLDSQYKFLNQHKSELETMFADQMVTTSELETMFADQMVTTEVKRRNPMLEDMYQVVISSKVVELKQAIDSLLKKTISPELKTYLNNTVSKNITPDAKPTVSV